MTEAVIAKASGRAARYAVEHWHYSKSMPVGKCFCRGLWEDDRFMGCVVFSRPVGITVGAGFARDFGLGVTEYVELNRVALDHAHVTPVSQIVAAAIKDLKATNPGLRLIVSFADPYHKHHGGIYQAGNWIFTGQTNPSRKFYLQGRIQHPKQISSMRMKANEQWLRAHVDPAARAVYMPGKYRYLYPLDRRMRKMILPLSRPYPAAEVSRATRVDSVNEGRVQSPAAAQLVESAS